AKGAENRVTLPAAFEDRFGDLERERRHVIVAFLSGVEVAIVAQVFTGHGVGHERPSRAVVGENLAILQRPVSWLAGHILLTSGCKQTKEKCYPSFPNSCLGTFAVPKQEFGNEGDVLSVCVHGNTQCGTSDTSRG